MIAARGNYLIAHTFPGIHVQGDTFAELRRQLADAAGRLRRSSGDGDALDDLDYAVADITQMLSFYETVLAEYGIPRPYCNESG